MKQKLQSIIDQKVIGNDATTILRSALEEYAATNYKSSELSQLIGQAEDVLLYGKKGRPTHRSYR